MLRACACNKKVVFSIQKADAWRSAEVACYIPWWKDTDDWGRLKWPRLSFLMGEFPILTRRKTVNPAPASPVPILSLEPILSLLQI